MGDDKPKREPLSEMDLLKQALKFSDADLDANRKGLLTEAQRQRWRDEQRPNTIGMAVVLLAVPVIFSVVGGGAGSAPLGLAIGILVSLVGAALLFVRILEGKMPPGELMAVQGEVTLYIGRDRTFLRIGDMKFRVSKEAVKVFRNRDVYNVYSVNHRVYFTDIPTIVSAEPLTEMFDEAREQLTQEGDDAEEAYRLHDSEVEDQSFNPPHDL